MNILYVGAFRLPNYDAAAARVISNAKAMSALGNTVKFLSWGGEYRLADKCPDGIFRIEGMPYKITFELDNKGSLFRRLKASFDRGKRSFNVIKTDEPKPDLIILYNADRRWTLKVMKYCKANHIKLATDITEWYDNNELHFWEILPYYINMTRTQRKVKNKILISNYLCDYYRGTNNLHLPPLCDQSEAKWLYKIDDKRIPQFEGVTLIYAGNPAKKDCVHIIINVVNKLVKQGKALRFIVIGISKESYLRRYRDQLDSDELHENIVFIDRVSQDNIPAYYRFADFMVLIREPSRKNMAGFPTKFAESISAGIPVIANCTSDLAEYILNNNAGFIVKTPEAQSLEDVLVNNVLTLSRPAIEDLKMHVADKKKAFDVYSYKLPINSFLANLQ